MIKTKATFTDEELILHRKNIVKFIAIFLSPTILLVLFFSITLATKIEYRERLVAFKTTIETFVRRQILPHPVETLNINVDKVISFLKNKTYTSKNITYNKKTKKKISAIMFTNVFGNLMNLKNLHKECKKRSIKLIEDAAESLGSFYLGDNKHSGLNADYGTLSFNVNKIITTGAGTFKTMSYS